MEGRIAAAVLVSPVVDRGEDEPFDPLVAVVVGGLPAQAARRSACAEGARGARGVGLGALVTGYRPGASVPSVRREYTQIIT